MKIEAPSPHRSTSPAVTQDHQPPYPTLLGYASCGVLSGDGLLPPGTGFPCKEGGKVPCNIMGAREMTSYPSLIVAVLPKRTAHQVSRMRLTAIQAGGGVWAWKTITRGKDGRGRFRRTFATLGKRPVVVLGVGSLAERAKRPRRKTCRLGVTPPSTLRTEWHARVDACGGNDAGHPHYRDSMAREVSRTEARLGVPDVEVESTGVGSA